MGTTIVFLLYCGLIASVPALPFFQNAMSGGIVLILTAAMALVAAASLSLDRYRRLPAGLVLLVGLAGTLLVMLLQVVPLPGGPLINPIWSSAAAATGEKPFGSITVDVGMTALAICRFSCMVAVALLAVLIGQHRHHAERLLWMLVGSATVVSLERLASFSPIQDSFQFLPPTAQGAAETIGILGIVMAIAVIVRGYERSRSLSKRRGQVTVIFTETAAALVAFVINLGAVAGGLDPAALLAALLGAGIVIAVLVIRKGRLSPWGQAGTAAVLVVALTTFIVFTPVRPDNEIVVRMAEDARLFGIGAGALAAMLPIYGSALSTTEIPLAATITIEMGRPFLWAITLIAAIWATILLGASLRRGRDYVYSAAGAGCIAALLISALSNGGSLALESGIILSAALGLAAAQSSGEAAGASVAAGSRPLSAGVTAPIYSSRPYLAGLLVVSGLLLAIQGVWIVLPEALRPAPIGLPIDERHAMVARQDKEKALKSASIAVVRGDLWAESAFTEAGMIWTDQAFEMEASGTRNAIISMSLLRTLHYAPHRGDAWLMLASTCERLKLQSCNTGAFLKMSYYTAPDQTRLLPLRLTQALRLKDLTNDEELADLARRDIRFVMMRSEALRPALIAAYRTASPVGRRLIEQTVAPVDSGYMTILRAQLT